MDVVVGDEDADVFMPESGYDGLDVLHGNGVDAGEGFVEHDELGVDGEATGNLGSPTFSAGESVAEVLADFLQAELFDKAFGFGLLIVFGAIGHLEYGADVVLDGHLAEDGGFLCKVADAEAGALVDGVVGDLGYETAYCDG